MIKKTTWYFASLRRRTRTLLAKHIYTEGIVRLEDVQYISPLPPSPTPIQFLPPISLDIRTVNRITSLNRRLVCDLLFIFASQVHTVSSESSTGRMLHSIIFNDLREKSMKIPRMVDPVKQVTAGEYKYMYIEERVDEFPQVTDFRANRSLFANSQWPDSNSQSPVLID